MMYFLPQVFCDKVLHLNILCNTDRIGDIVGQYCNLSCLPSIWVAANVAFQTDTTDIKSWPKFEVTNINTFGKCVFSSQEGLCSME